MSAATRLWRRAPLWRTAVLLCLTATALAALFPSPALLHAIGARTGPAVQPDLVVTPSIQPTFRNRMGFAGRMLALPQGDWHQLLIVQRQQAGGITMMALARFEAGALTGLVVTRASASPVAGPPLSLRPDACRPPDAFATSGTAGVAGGSSTCWLVRRTDLDAAAGDQPGQDPLAGASFDRLRASDIATPVLRLQSAWYATDGREFLEATLYEPGQAGNETEALTAAASRMRRDWSVRLARDLAASSE